MRFSVTIPIINYYRDKSIRFFLSISSRSHTDIVNGSLEISRGDSSKESPVRSMRKTLRVP